MADILDGFRVYEKQRTSPGALPQVTVQARGIFSLNPSAYGSLGSPEFVELLYSEQQQAVALRAVESETQTSYQVRPTNNGGTFNVAGRAFMVYYGINLPESRRYTPKHAKDGVIILRLEVDPYVALLSTRGSSRSGDDSKLPPSENEVVVE